MKAEYRIVRDAYAGYEVQFKPWWSPFWWQAGGSNTHCSIEKAEAFAHQHAKPEVKHLGCLPKSESEP